MGARLLNPVAMSGYLLPFFMTPAGPVNVYSDHCEIADKAEKPPEFASFIGGADLIASGLFLKFVIAELLRLFFIGATGNWPTETFAESVTIFVFLFFDFAGYSLIALGVGKLLEIPTPINFRAPFVSKSLTEFWTRWHVSLGDFVRRTIFTPCQVALIRRFGVGNAQLTNFAALVISFAFVGLWHRLTPGFLLWGLLVGVLVGLERLLAQPLADLAARYPRISQGWVFLGPVYTLGTIILTLHFVMPDLLGA